MCSRIGPAPGLRAATACCAAIGFLAGASRAAEPPERDGIALTASTALGNLAATANAGAGPTAAAGEQPQLPLALRPATQLDPGTTADAARPGSASYSQAIVNVSVNGVAHGELFAYLGPGQDFLFSANDLAAMNIVAQGGRTVEIAGEAFISLRSFSGIQLKFDERSLNLDIVLPPAMLPGQRLDLGATQPRKPVQARAPGGFLNYSLGYADAVHSNGTLNGTTELGVSVGQLLFLNTHNFTVGDGQNHAVRLQTQLIYDQPEQLRRFVAGDVFASSGELGSTFNLGGLSVSKVYEINPYFLKQPLLGFSGAVAAPSNADVYIDGAKVSTAKLAPGNFNLQSLNFANGLHNVDLVIRDPFGGEQHVSFPYFFNDQLLAKGLQEYSYNLGFIRNNYGTASFDYGHPAASAFHRYGVSDNLTIGAGGDLTVHHINIGPRVLFNSGAAGIFSAGYAVSRDSTAYLPAATSPTAGARSGNATSLGYTYLSGPFSLQGAARRFSENYTLIGVNAVNQPRLQASAGISYGNRDVGTFTLTRSVQTVYGGASDQRSTALSYARTIGRDLSLIATVGRGSQATPSATGFDVTSGYSAFIGLSYFSPTGRSANVNHQRFINGSRSDDVQIANTTPVGEGWGYRVLAQRNVASGVPSEVVSPYVQYNARNAIFIAQGNTTSTMGVSSTSYQVSVAGAAVYIGDRVYLSRPVDDSYGLVKIAPPLAGVRVTKSNAEVGITEAGGTVFVPNLGSYQINSVEIQPRDLPLDYSVPSARQDLRPPLRGGTVATFSVKRVRAVTGKLMRRSENGLVPLDDYELPLIGKTQGVRVRTVRGGDFYLENLEPGTYTGQLRVAGKTCKFGLTVPDTREIVADLGSVICEDSP